MTIRDQVIMSQNRNATDILNRNRGGSSTSRSFDGSWRRNIPDAVSRQFTREADRVRGTLNNLQDVSGNTNNADEQLQAVRRVVNSFNDMLSSAREYGGRSVTRLERELASIVRDNPDELRQMGITVNRDGSVRMNHSRVRAAAERGDISRIVNNSGFVNSLAATVGTVRSNPTPFLTIVSHVRPQSFF
ncbi:MAG: hypothetical protein FWC70_00135 [Defluviitaleaceae bacterium]|nr:hypothetical protein [Defluviitaleaceae bacterium]